PPARPGVGQPASPHSGAAGVRGTGGSIRRRHPPTTAPASAESFATSFRSAGSLAALRSPPHTRAPAAVPALAAGTVSVLPHASSPPTTLSSTPAPSRASLPKARQGSLLERLLHVPARLKRRIRQAP